MFIIEVQFTPLSKPYWFNPENHTLAIGDSVIVKTEIGLEIGKIIALKDISDSDEKIREIKPIIRKANQTDLDKCLEKNKHKEKDLEIARELITKNNLEMKIVDLHYSFDGGRLTFYFTASGRIDFRNLVKDLTHHFQKSIRLFQIGVRDEARSLGEIGSCGKKLCCKSFLAKLEQINSTCSNLQQVTHRGNERLAGICGRLKCCLKFEQKTYELLAKDLPEINSIINTPQGKARVNKHLILKEAIEAELLNDPGKKIEVKI